MKKLSLILIALVLLFAVICVVPDLSFSQPPPPPTKPEQNPIDGGLALLAVAGGAYAINKLKDRKK